MPNNTINISFDILGLQGAQRITGKDGREYVAICLPDSRVNAHNNGKCYLSLDVKANKDGADDYGKTHFVCEATTKEERLAKVRLPIIGNGKEFIFDQQPAQRLTPQQQAEGEGYDPKVSADDDDIPF